MLIGLIWFALACSSIRSATSALDVSRDPDPVKQARQERIMKLALAAGLGVLGARDRSRSN